MAAGTGGYCALPQDVGATLTFSSGNGGTYTYTPSPGQSYTYASGGALTAETDAAGNTLTVTYGTPAARIRQLPGHRELVRDHHLRLRPRADHRLQRRQPGHLGHRPDGPAVDLRLHRLAT